MSRVAFIRLVFGIGALYDGVLGLAFLVAGPAVYAQFNVAPPNHWGYVQFPATLLVVFALMFLAIALNPRQNRNLIPYGVLLKVCYCAVTLYYWLTIDIPWMWKPFTILDLGFLVLFLWSYFALEQSKSR